MQGRSDSEAGFTLIELLLSLAIAALLLTTMTGVVNSVFDIQQDTDARNVAMRDGRFAMQRMVTAVLGTDRLLLPLADNPGTNWRENVREQTVPASPPEGSSTLATAVLAVTLPSNLDIDADGFADADNDKDGRVDEDPGGDLSWDLASGIIYIDDDGDGLVDELHAGSGPAGEDDDEDGAANEDGWNDIDDDGDAVIDEDPKMDMSGDGLPGVGGVDDDADGSVDEGDKNDDDEDGQVNEDWFDAVVFFVNGATLIERRPNLNPADGTDYTEFDIADNVTRFRVERVSDAGKRAQIIDLTLELAYVNGETISLNTRVRLGGGT